MDADENAALEARRKVREARKTALLAEREGAKTKREEVAAEVAAREEAEGT